jgi:transketolase
MGDQQSTRAKEPTRFDAARLTDLARTLRRDVLEMTTEAGSGHPSSSFSIVEIMSVLYFGGVLRYDPQNPHWPERDRFILSKGHAAPILYAVLAEAGYFPKSELMTLRKYGSPLEGHPNMRRLAGVEASTGSLGQGLSIGLGQALAARSAGRLYNVFVVTGDGELEEGQVWEAAMSAANLKTGNLIAIVDNNGFQQTTAVSHLTDPSLYAEKWRAFGWKTVEINGHDLNEVRQALVEATEYTEGPFAIIAHTVKGKGLHFMETDFTWHGRAVPKDQLAAALEEIG